MRLENFRLSLIRKAVQIYLERAFGDGWIRRLPEMVGDDDAPLSDHMHIFEQESPPGTARCGARFVMRLGNHHYPFMKLVLQECLIEGEYFLSVDTHDEMFVEQGEDAEALREVKRFNSELKEEIERAWQHAGIPTSGQLKGLVELLPVERESAKSRTVLLVDDEGAIADTVELLLRAKGYEVDRASNGCEALERVTPGRHDIILIDNEMPQMSGLDVCRILKERNDTRDIPILLATAGKIDIGQIRRAEGFLTKPFRSDVLFSFIAHLVALHPRRS
ncbi:MAG: response regulator [Planctomycetota bacterium]